MPGKIRLLCWVQGDDPRHYFAIRVGPRDSILELKEAIREKKPTFQNIAADFLEPWKVRELHWRPSVHNAEALQVLSAPGGPPRQRF